MSDYTVYTEAPSLRKRVAELEAKLGDCVSVSYHKMMLAEETSGLQEEVAELQADLEAENERLKAAVDAQAAYIATPFSEEATRMGNALAALEDK